MSVSGNDRERIGARIASIRHQQGITQKQLAELAGLPRSNVARIEAGTHSTGLDVLSTIADALGMKIDFVKNPEKDKD